MCRTVSDPAFQNLYLAIKQPFCQIIASLRVGYQPQSLPEPHPVRQFSSILDLNIDSGSSGTLIRYQEHHRLVVPHSAIKEILTLLHKAHQRITKTSFLPSSFFFWPGMSKENANLMNNCEVCQTCQNSRRET
ncbi:unnamed protein product [Lepeophtheirus salmonis]|uniref:RNA-directed DNA polymerase n=1 Tax=Lepeophtheirus salmonis TaxID=72036 RepID=A0A7R8CJY8_LEPSM|nr:unnamed protein product [Lepeophtheirus salmonis]CAF2840702.1 unnamed protein product [Lepeophtheirus salmonis]